MSPTEHGMVFFKSQKERLKEYTHGFDGPKKRSVTIHDVIAEPTLSPTKKAIISETLREVSTTSWWVYVTMVTTSC